MHDVKLLGPRASLRIDLPTSFADDLDNLPTSSFAVNMPGWSISAFNVSGTLAHTDLRTTPLLARKVNPYPSRPILRSSIPANVPLATLEDWASSVGLVLGLLIPSEADRHKVFCLMYHYRHLNETDLIDLPYIYLITHRVRIKPGTKPASNSIQKRWPAHLEWWLRKIIQDSLAGRVYELTEPARIPPRTKL